LRQSEHGVQAYAVGSDSQSGPLVWARSINQLPLVDMVRPLQ
jgi:hypothetical protein